MDENALRSAVIERSEVDEQGKRKLGCAVAFAISAELDVSTREIGKICNAEGIKICNCQLGCF